MLSLLTQPSAQKIAFPWEIGFSHGMYVLTSYHEFSQAKLHASAVHHVSHHKPGCFCVLQNSNMFSQIIKERLYRTLQCHVILVTCHEFVCVSARDSFPVRRDMTAW